MRTGNAYLGPPFAQLLSPVVRLVSLLAFSHRKLNIYGRILYPVVDVAVIASVEVVDESLPLE